MQLFKKQKGAVASMAKEFLVLCFVGVIVFAIASSTLPTYIQGYYAAGTPFRNNSTIPSLLSLFWDMAPWMMMAIVVLGGVATVLKKIGKI